MAKRAAQITDTAIVRISDISPCDVVHVDEHRVTRAAPLELPRDEADRLVALSDHLTVEDA